MSYVAGVLLASVLFAVFGLFWRGPESERPGAGADRKECESCPLAGADRPPRHLRIVR